MYSSSQFKKGIKILIDGEPFLMTESQFVKPGKGQAFNRVRLKSLISGRVIDRTYKSGEKVPKADIEERSMQYLYNDGESYHFMDTSNYEQVSITKEALGQTALLLVEEASAQVLLFNGQPINVELPNFVVLQVEYCEPAVRGDTSSGASKTARLTTGLEIQVPLFIEQEGWLKIDTRTVKYVERAQAP